MYAKLLWYMYNWKEVLKGKAISSLKEQKLKPRTRQIQGKICLKMLWMAAFIFFLRTFLSPVGNKQFVWNKYLESVIWCYKWRIQMKVGQSW